MDHARAFLEAITAEPDDDAHRLVYADWLDEYGGAPERARAAFIRAQVWSATLPADDPTRADLEDEARGLLAEHQAEWMEGWPSVADAWEFRRGFVERMELPGASFVKYADRLMAVTPLREVHLLLPEEEMAALAACPHLARIESLDFGPPAVSPRRHYLRDRALMTLLASPHLGRLKALKFAGQGLEGGGVQALAESPWLANLRYLDLSGNRGFGDRAARILATADRASRLEELRLRDTNLTAAGVRALLSSDCLPALRTLDLWTGILFRSSPDAADAVRGFLALPRARQLTTFDFSECPRVAGALPLLGSPPGLERLRELDLSGCRVGDAGALALAESPGFAGLTALNLAECNLGPAGVQALLASPHLTGLRALRLGGNNLRDAGAKALAASPHLRRLACLDLRDNAVGGPGLRALAESPHAGGLRELDLSRNYVGAASVAALADSPHLHRLTHLNLSGVNLEADGVRALAASSNLGRLTHLNLSGNFIGQSGAEALAASPHPRRLSRLDVRENDLTDREWDLLRERFGRAVVR